MWHFASEYEAAGFLAINGKRKQRSFVYGCEVTGALIFVCVVLADQLQRFTQLEQGCELVLAVVTAKAGARQPTDCAIPIFEFDLIGFAAFNDGITLASIDAEIPHLIARVVFVAAFCDCAADFHA